MDRNREARRGAMAAAAPSVNGGGLSRRRQRSSGLRDSPEEDGGMELQETGRMRDRGSKKDRDRDRDRSSRNKRRRGDRMLHGSSREEGEDSSEESVDDDDEDEDDDPGPTAAPLRLPPPSLPPPSNSSVTASSLPPNHHQRKSFPVKIPRAPGWKGEEIIGVSVPRKARSASAKRSHECSISGSGAGGGASGGGGGSGSGELIHRQTSTSPARPSLASTAPISPSSSNSTVRKKMKLISGKKHRPLKISKSPSSVQDIEFEVAEVLFGMTRQFPGPSKQDGQKSEAKDANGMTSEAKSRVSSPNSISLPPAASQSSHLAPPNSSAFALPQLPAVAAPKRKRPRPVKFDEESPTSPSNQVAPSSTSKMGADKTTKMEVPSPKLEKNTTPSVVENGVASNDVHLPQDIVMSIDKQHESEKLESDAFVDSKPLVPEVEGSVTKDGKEDPSSPPKKPTEVEFTANQHEASVKKAAMVVDSPRAEKFKIDLMAPPPGKSSPEAEDAVDFGFDYKPAVTNDMNKRPEIGKMEEEKVEKIAKQEIGATPHEEKMVERKTLQEFESKEPKAKERSLDLQLDIERADDDAFSGSRQQAQKQHQSKLPKPDAKSDKGQTASIPLPVAVGGWPGGLPPMGYMGQVPSLQAFPMDMSNGSSKAMQPPSFLSPQLRPKRCATHCYIAQNILYHQQLSRMNPFWPAAPGGVTLFGAKPYNLNVVPPSESVLVNPLQGFPGRSLPSIQEKAGPVAAVSRGHSSMDKNSAGNKFPDTSQRKPLVLQQSLQGGSTSGMLHAPAFILPMNQQQAAAAAAARSGAVKSSVEASNVSPSSNASTSASTASTTTVSFNYPNMPTSEAQYMAFLQNNGYQFPVPAHVGAPPQYRVNPPQAMPFFNGSFYTSQMLHPSQLQQHPQQAQHPTQQGHQNTSTSSGSTSSLKPAQQPRVPGAGTSGTGGASHGLPSSKPRQHLPTHPSRQLEGDAGGEESPSTADSRTSHVQKGMYGPNFAVPLHPQEYALMSHAAALSNSGLPVDKQHPTPSQQQQQHNNSSQPFALSFASLSGAAPGFDFSSIAQNHPFFHSLPEAARQGYQIAAAAAAQHKKPHHPEDGKSSGESISAAISVEEERKMVSTSKVPTGFPQHSLAFSRSDVDAPIAAILSNSVIDSSARTLNLIPAPMNGSRTSNHTATAVPSNTTTVSSNASNHIQQQQQQQQYHLSQIQQLHNQQQHQQMQMQHQIAPRAKSSASSNSASVYSDRLSSGPMPTKLSNALGDFNQALIQGSISSQSPQWKNSARTTTVVPSSPNPSPLAMKNQLPQQQGRVTQPVSSTGHQMQISFGSNNQKAQQGGQQGGLNNNPSPSSGASVIVGSPQTSSMSKGAGGSPRASTGSKPGPPATALPFQQQPPQSKSSPSSSSRKSSPVSNRSVPSILGNPPSSQNSSNKPQQQHHHQQQHQQQQPQKYPFPPSPLFFSNPYMQPQAPQSNVAAGYYQRRPTDQQQQTPSQQQQQPSSTGMLSLCPPSLTMAGATTTSDPAKAMAAAANNMKGLPPTSFLQAAVAQGGHHALMSAPGFPYIQAVPSMSMKPAEQKPAAGNDNLHACWQPEKR